MKSLARDVDRCRVYGFHERNAGDFRARHSLTRRLGLLTFQNLFGIFTSHVLISNI